MMLLIDAGNTRVKWALAEPGAPLGKWLASGAVAHADIDQLPAAWQAALAGHGPGDDIAHGAAQAAIPGTVRTVRTVRTVSRAMLANVAGAALHDRLAAMLPATETTDVVLCISAPAKTPRNAHHGRLLVDRRMSMRRVREVLSWSPVVTRSRPRKQMPTPAVSSGRTSRIRNAKNWPDIGPRSSRRDFSSVLPLRLWQAWEPWAKRPFAVPGDGCSAGPSGWPRF